MQATIKNSLSCKTFSSAVARIIILAGLIQLFSGQNAQAKSLFAIQRPIAVMIPGTLNSLIPGENEERPYFSGSIISTVEDEGYEVSVVKGLSPMGTFEENSRVVENAVMTIQKDLPNASMIFIGHSAGGIYGLAAASRLKVPPSKIFLVSTPLIGSELADRAFANPFFGHFLDAGVNMGSYILDVRGLPELTAQKVQEFLQTLRLPENLKIIATAGYQERAGFFSGSDARLLNPVFSLINVFMTDSIGDGVVAVASSLGLSTKTDSFVYFNGPNGERIDIERSPIIAKLDHFEECIDARFLAAMRFQNTDDIRAEQERFFRQILRTGQ